MSELSYQTRIRNYYNKLESRIGYTFVLGNAKHFGYYPEGIKNISEKEALIEQQDLIAKTLKLKEGESVLDAGCGRGVTASYIAKKYNVNITGIDLLDFELKKAREIAKREGVGIDFKQMDYSNMDLPDNNFDAIYTSETLSHVEDIKKVLSNFFKVLKLGGRFVFMEYTIADDGLFTKEDMNNLNYVIEGSAMFGLKKFRHDKFPDILRSIGFIDVEEKDITKNIRSSFDNLYSKSRLPYKIAKIFSLDKKLINVSTPSKLKPLIEKGLIRYCVFSGVKSL